MSTAADRVTAPFGARMVPVIGRERHGPYIVLGCADTAGPRPAAGQFYMVMASRWGGGDGERPFLPRAFSSCAPRAQDRNSSSWSRTSGPAPSDYAARCH